MEPNQPLPPVPPGPPSQRGQGYSLSMLFLVVAAISVLLGLCTIALKEAKPSFGDDVQQYLYIGIVLLAAAIGGAMIGAMVGVFHHLRLRGIFYGALTGACIVPLLTPLFFAPRVSLAAMTGMTVFGCGLLLIMALVIRYNLSKRG